MVALDSDQQALVEEHMPLVTHIAQRFTAGRSVDIQTAISDGILGLISAVKRYDSDQGKFSSFAYSRILGAIQDEQRARTKMRWNREWQPPVFVSLDEMAENVEGSDALDRLPAMTDKSASALDRLLNTEMNENVHEALAALSAREQQIIKLYYFDKMRYNRIALELGISESRTCQIAARALRRLRAKLEPQELLPALS